MSTEENKAIIRRWFEKVINEKRLDRVRRARGAGLRGSWGLPGQAPGVTGAKKKRGMYITAVPDLRSWSEDMVAEGDEVAVRWTAEGTHQGELLGVLATGKEFRFTGLSICRLAEGKMAEQWEEWDKLDLMRQLGVMPSPVQGKR